MQNVLRFQIGVFLAQGQRSEVPARDASVCSAVEEGRLIARCAGLEGQLAKAHHDKATALARLA